MEEKAEKVALFLGNSGFLVGERPGGGTQLGRSQRGEETGKAVEMRKTKDVSRISTASAATATAGSVFTFDLWSPFTH